MGTSVVLVLGGLALVPALPASAAPSCVPSGPGHIYDVAWYCGTNTGIRGVWNDADLSVTNATSSDGNPAGYATSEIWDYTNPSGPQFVEVGLFYGNSEYWGWSNPAGYVQAYELFWGDESGSGTYYFHYIDNISPSTESFSYSITSNGNNQWSIGVDTLAAGTSTVQVTSTGWQAATGSDILNPWPGDTGGTFNMNDGVNVNYSWEDPAFNGSYISPGWTCQPPTIEECYNAQVPSPDGFNWNFGNQT